MSFCCLHNDSSNYSYKERQLYLYRAEFNFTTWIPCDGKLLNSVVHVMIILSFYFGVLHPVACTLSRLLEEPSPQQLFKVFIYTYSLPLHVSAFAGHFRAEYTIFWEVTSLTTNPLCFCYKSYLYMFLANRPPLWSSGQSSWLQIRRPGFDSRHYQKKSSGSGTGSTQPREYNWGATWQKSSGSCLENREYGRRDPSRSPRGTLYPQKLAITSPTSGVARSVVRSRTQTMEFYFLAILPSST
jgi:hypothetical protein